MTARDDSVLLASYSCVALFIERGTTEVSVAELAENAGIARRTFFRYFDTKEESVRPVLREGMLMMSNALAERPPTERLGDALASALATAAAGPLIHRTRGLIALIDETTLMRTVWAQAIHEGEAVLSAPIAARLGWSATDPRAAVLATVVTALVRSALTDAVRRRTDPVAVFRDYISVIDSPAFGLRATTSQQPREETQE